MANYLFDTNNLIALADPNATTDSTERQKILQNLVSKLNESENTFFLTPLVRYEVLRNVNWHNIDRLNAIIAVLQQFKSLDITDDVSDLSRDLYRFDEYESKRDNINKNLEKRKFDTFHFAAAVKNELELLSNDTDISKIQGLYQRMLQEQQ